MSLHAHTNTDQVAPTATAQKCPSGIRPSRFLLQDWPRGELPRHSSSPWGRSRNNQPIKSLHAALSPPCVWASLHKSSERPQITLVGFISGIYPLTTVAQLHVHTHTYTLSNKKGKKKTQNFWKSVTWSHLQICTVCPETESKHITLSFLLTLQNLAIPITNSSQFIFVEMEFTDYKNGLLESSPFLWTLRPFEFDPDQADHKPFCLDNRGNGTVCLQ